MERCSRIRAGPQLRPRAPAFWTPTGWLKMYSTEKRCGTPCPPKQSTCVIIRIQICCHHRTIHPLSLMSVDQLPRRLFIFHSQRSVRTISCNPACYPCGRRSASDAGEPFLHAPRHRHAIPRGYGTMTRIANGWSVGHSVVFHFNMRITFEP